MRRWCNVVMIIKSIVASGLIFIFPTKLWAIQSYFFEKIGSNDYEIILQFGFGSADDPNGKSGLTALLFNTLLESSSHTSAKQLDALQKSLGATIDVEIYPETSVLRCTVPTEHLKDFLTLLTERLSQPKFDVQEIRAQKAALIKVAKERTTHPKEFLRDTFKQYLFQNHSFQNRGFGKEKDISTITKQDLVDYYAEVLQELYIALTLRGPDRPPLIGDFLRTLESTFPFRSTKTELPFPLRQYFKSVFIEDSNDSWVNAIFGLVSAKTADPNIWKFYVGQLIFGGTGFRSRLSKMTLSQPVQTSFGAGSRPGPWQIELRSDIKTFGSDLQTILQGITAFQTQGVTEEELLAAKNWVATQSIQIDNFPKFSYFFPYYKVGFSLYGGLLEEGAQAIRVMTLKDLNVYLSQTFKIEGLTFVIHGPKKQLSLVLEPILATPAWTFKSIGR